MILLPPAADPSGPAISSSPGASSPRAWGRSLCGVLRDRAVWIVAAVVGLSLMNVYVLVLRDAVHQGEMLRAGFAAGQPTAGPVTQPPFEAAVTRTDLRFAAAGR
jgi:hypothetical protein